MKYVLYKAGRHGLGNRLLVLTTAIGICRSTGAKLVVDWKNSSCHGDDFWDFFRLAGCEDIVSETQDPAALNGMTSAQQAWNGVYDRHVDSVYEEVTSQGQFAHVDLQEIPPISGLSTYFQGQKQKDVLVLCGYSSRGQRPELLLRHLRLVPDLLERLEGDIRRIKGARPASEFVGLHVRAAYQHFPKPDHDKIMAFLASRGNRTLILATDSEDEQAQIKLLLKDKVICTNKHFPKLPNKHTDTDEPFALHTIVFNAGGGRSLEGIKRADVFYQALLDWALLSSCPIIYWQPASTFSKLILLFGCCKPWTVFPHCKCSWRERWSGVYWAALKYQSRPSLFPGFRII